MKYMVLYNTSTCAIQDAIPPSNVFGSSFGIDHYILLKGYIKFIQLSLGKR